MKVFDNGKDVGYLDDQNWWLNPEHPNAFLIQSLDDNYPEEYFKIPHVCDFTVNNLCKNVSCYFSELTGRKLKSIAEFGCGGGWFLKGFQEMGLMLIGVEGSLAGVKKCKDIGLIVLHEDLRRKVRLNGRCDMVVCTEVAEHIEIPFSGMLVENLIYHSDLIWFSTEEPNTNKPHIHHPNERPYKFWINLFEFYNYGCYMLPDEVYNDCEGRGRMIFYNKKTITI